VFVLVGAHLEVGKRATAIAEWGGRISYPLYIIHFPILRLLNHVARDRLSEGGRLWALAVEIPAIVGLAWLALVCFDEPVRAALSRWKPRRQAEPLTAAAP
jgi:peptidoglycan/LPS O-acetylase OafA/YrhL